MRSGIRLAAAALVCAFAAGCGSPPGPSTVPTSPAGVTSTAAPTSESPSPTSPPPSTTPSATAPSTPTADPKPSGSKPADPKPSGSKPTGSKPSGPAERPVIVIDPGHSGRSIRSRTTHGLLDFDYPNQPEMTEAFDISSCVAQGLRADGYRVILTKKRASDSVSLTERAEIANRAKADLAISVHDDHGQGPSFQATYSQLGVKANGRYHEMYRGTGSRRTVFDLPAVAKASDRAARLIARERAQAQGRPVSVRENSFNGRAPLEPGNLALVQLLADVPWVYNELGALTDGSTTKRLSLAAETGYAKGLLDGVEAAVPTPGASGSPTSTAQVRSCLAARR